LPKFRKTNPNLDDKLTQWLLFIDDFNNEGIKMAESKNQTLKQAWNTMNYLTEDEEVKRLNELRENWALDRFFDMRSAEEKQ